MNETELRIYQLWDRQDLNLHLGWVWLEEGGAASYQLLHYPSDICGIAVRCDFPDYSHLLAVVVTLHRSRKNFYSG